jgi:hypothetical protein
MRAALGITISFLTCGAEALAGHLSFAATGIRDLADSAQPAPAEEQSALMVWRRRYASCHYAWFSETSYSFEMK